ncbi:histidine kinase [Winogradskyella sp. 3972H.M.0a.05]|uniref:sensor histidine kinase n=1 Tax=Winogradskyella sp. 3972H.M.0a.05 TaxID=2950277 RepID=UPI003395DBEC
MMTIKIGKFWRYFFSYQKVDKQLVIILLGYYLIVEILFYTKILLWKYNLVEQTPLTPDLSNIGLLTLFVNEILLDYLAVIGVMLFIAGQTKSMINNRVRWRNIIALHFVYAFSLGWVILFFVAIVHLLFNRSIESIKGFLSLEHYLNIIDLNFLTYTSMLGIILIYYYVKNLKKIENEKVVLTNELTESKVRILKSQLRPHFLFNSMQTISNLLHIDPDYADKAIADLSDILRHSINQLNVDFISIEEELDLTEKYLEFQKFRFDNKVLYRISCDNYLKQFKVPPFILQPLVENSIKHGYEISGENIEIVINVKDNGNWLLLEVIDNGEGFEVDYMTKENSTGLKNLKNRLQYLYRDQFNLNIVNLDRGAMVEIKLLKKK